MLKQRDRCIIAAAIGVVVLTAFIQAGRVQAQQSSIVSSQRVDSQALAKFALVVDGVELGVFTQLTSTADLETGAARPTITLAGGQTLTKTIELAAWHELVVLGDVAAARRNVVVIVYGTSGTPVKSYDLTNAWPAKLTLDSARGQLRTEGIVLTHEGFRRE